MTFRGWRVHRARSQLFASLGHIQSKCCFLFWHFDWHARRWAGKWTLACTGLETLRPYFLLLHASCSHSSSVLSSCFSRCQLTFTPSPLNIPFGLSSPLVFSSLLFSVQGVREMPWQEAQSLSPCMPASPYFHRSPPPFLMHFSF